MFDATNISLRIQIEETDYKGEIWYVASNSSMQTAYGRTPERAVAFLLDEISKTLKMKTSKIGDTEYGTQRQGE